MANENFGHNPLAAYATTDFDSVMLKLASPERIKDWSWGEVTKPETINYRTQRSEKNGLFDEKIFGPERDFECYCGKYKGIRYKGIVCEKCGVEVTRSIVRRERMGHIDLAAPVAHIWFLRGVPSRMATLLGIKTSDLEKVIYFAGYIVTAVHEDERKHLLEELEREFKSKVKTLNEEKAKDKLKEVFLKTKEEIQNITVGSVIEDTEYNRYSMRYGSVFDADIGAEAIHGIFKEMNLEAMEKSLVKDLEKTRSQTVRARILKRLGLIRSLIASDSRPEWMFLTAIPVLPPALRPMVALEGGRHATSDVNDLYRRVINRNNRLKKLISINAPHVILRNEKRILQEAVDALIDNSIRRAGGAYASATGARRPLKSLADNLKGKQGLFRQNLLGKRVDYSGRSVIVIGPDLDLDECGLPKTMALELFRPFVVSRLIELELAHNIRGANKLIDDQAPEVWAILEEVIEGKYVLLNRAPTLHRLGIQAFRPRLVEGQAIHVHPLVCSAFNADFDGDQMAVHVPLSEEAQAEAREIMASNKNLLKPGSGRPIAAPTGHDIVLGTFWMTKVEGEGEENNLRVFSSPNYAITAFDYGAIKLRQTIKVLPTDSAKYAQFNGELFETTVGRLLFNSVLPSDFPYINETIDKKKMLNLVDQLIDTYGVDRMPSILDKIKAFGFRYATYAGTTWSIDDVPEVTNKPGIIERALDEVAQIRDYYQQGLLSERERYQKIIHVWSEVRNQIEEEVEKALPENSSSFDMIKSGARGSIKQMTNMAGLKGLIINNKGEQIEFPVLTGAKEGHTPIEYFITTHGSRKGLTDTALNTATAGYLTRKLFDVAQDVVITYSDKPEAKGYITLREENLGGIVISLARNIEGRYLATDLKDEKDNVLYKKNTYVNKEIADAIEAAGVKEVNVYSPLVSNSASKLSVMCYGQDPGTNGPVALGEAVGTIAAQAIGEPGTQLTMRTFHSGGTASQGGDIVQGLPRIIELFERRIPKSPAVVSHTDGKVTAIEENGYEKIIKILSDDGSKKGKAAEESYRVLQYRTPIIKVGDQVRKGQLITDGSADLQELFQYAGKEATQEYIIREVRKVYELQGASISRKHIEIIVAQMFSRVRVTNPGDSDYTRGQIVERDVFEAANEAIKEAGGETAEGKDVVLGISEVALSRESWLSAASFQHTTRVLIEAAVAGTEDPLKGLKENVIIGRLIPAGTGFPGSPKHEMITKLQEEIAARAPRVIEEGDDIEMA